MSLTKQIAIVISFLLLTLISKGQQEAFYSVYWNNPSIYNPATTGEQSKYYGAINYRNQWNQIGSPGHPWDVAVLFEMNFDSINSAFGINYSHNQFGLEKSGNIGFNYSYHIKLKNKQKIGIGIGPTFTIKELDNRFIAIDDFTQDPSIPQEDEKINLFDLNIGLSYLSKKFKAGIATTKVLESKDELGGRLYQNQMRLLIHASYDFLIGSNFKFIPQFRFTTDFTSRIYEGSLIAEYNGRYWIGGSYRSDVAFGMVAGIDIAEKVRLGYAFDYYRNSTFDFNLNGAHEVVFAIMLN